MCEKCNGKGYIGDFPGAPPEDVKCAACSGTGVAEEKVELKKKVK